MSGGYASTIARHHLRQEGMRAIAEDAREKQFSQMRERLNNPLASTHLHCCCNACWVNESAGAVAARSDLKKFLLRRLKRAMENRRWRIHNQCWFRIPAWGRDYCRELKRVLGPGFLVYREQDKLGGRPYVGIYIGLWPDKLRQKSGLIKLM